jgi:hypothetical protein
MDDEKQARLSERLSRVEYHAFDSERQCECSSQGGLVFIEVDGAFFGSDAWRVYGSSNCGKLLVINRRPSVVRTVLALAAERVLVRWSAAREKARLVRCLTSRRNSPWLLLCLLLLLLLQVLYRPVNLRRRESPLKSDQGARCCARPWTAPSVGWVSSTPSSRGRLVCSPRSCGHSRIRRCVVRLRDNVL